MRYQALLEVLLMKILKRIDIESEVFTEHKGSKIFKIKSKTELYGLMNKMPLRLLFDGKTLFAWSAFDFDHKEVKEVLREYKELNDNFEGFLIEKEHLVPSLQKKSGMVEKFINRYFPNCRMERDKDGIILTRS